MKLETWVSRAVKNLRFDINFIHKFDIADPIDREDELAAGSVILQAMLASFIFIYIIRFKVTAKQMSTIYLVSFLYISINPSASLVLITT